MSDNNVRNSSKKVNVSLSKRKIILKCFYNKCYICGYTHFLDIHHIKHKKDGGENTVENCVVLCPNHHKEWHYIENTYFRTCVKANKERLNNGRDIKAFEMCIDAVRDVFESNKTPFLEVIEKYGKSDS